MDSTCLLRFEPTQDAARVHSLRAAEAVRIVARKEPEPPSCHVPAVPPALDDICLRCLAKLPTDRYTAADQLAAVLESFLKWHIEKTVCPTFA